MKRKYIILLSCIMSLLFVGILFFLYQDRNAAFLVFRARCKNAGGVAERRDNWPGQGMVIGFFNVCHMKREPSDIEKVCKSDEDCIGTCERRDYLNDYFDDTDVYQCTDVLFYDNKMRDSVR